MQAVAHLIVIIRICTDCWSGVPRETVISVSRSLESTGALCACVITDFSQQIFCVIGIFQEMVHLITPQV